MASMTPSTLADVVSQAETQSASLNAQNLAAENEIRDIYDQLIARYRPGGADYERSNLLFQQEKRTGVGQRTHSLMSRGLSNTTQDPEAQWMRDTGSGLAASLEDVLSARYSQAMMGKAGFISGIERSGISPAQVGQYAANIGGGGGTRITGGVYPGSGWSDGIAQIGTYQGYNEQLKAGGGSSTPRKDGYYGSWIGGAGNRYSSSSTGTSTSTSTSKPATQSSEPLNFTGLMAAYKPGFNYSAHLYKRGGGSVSDQQTAYNKLRDMGVTSLGF